MLKKFLILFLFLILPYYFLNAQSFSRDYYFCTDEYINLIYLSNDNNKSLYITSFTADNNIHIADSRQNDNRQEGDNPISLRSSREARTNLNKALRLHTRIERFAKNLFSYTHNTNNENLGYLAQKDKVRITLKRITGDSTLINKTVSFKDKSQYLYISPKQILGRNYGCGRGVRLIVEKINTPPILERVNFDYDIQNRLLYLGIDVDESLREFSLKILEGNREIFSYSSSSPTTTSSDFIYTIPIDLNNLPPNTQLSLKLRMKDLEGAEAEKSMSFRNRDYLFRNPKLTEILIESVRASEAIIKVLTTKITESPRDLNTRSFIYYGTSSSTLNLVNSSTVNQRCQFNRITYDCAIHRLTNLSSSTDYYFIVRLINDADLVTTSSIRSFRTLGLQSPTIKDFSVNLRSVNNYYDVNVTGRVVDESPPIEVKARINNRDINVNFRNMIFNVKITIQDQIPITTTSRLSITVKNSFNLERILEIILPKLKD
jgi:hypothetical protein